MSTPFARLYQLRSAIDLPAGQTAAAGMVIDATGEKLGFKFIASSSKPIKEVSAYVYATGMSSVQFNLAIYDDANDAPNNLQGAAIANFSGIGPGWTSLKTLQSQTGALTPNAAYWLVLSYVSGTISGYLQGYTGGTGRIQPAAKIRHYTGGNWTTTTPVMGDPLIVLKHDDGSYAGGLPLSGAGDTTSGVNDIFSTNRQGLRMRVGAPARLQGVSFDILKTGSPANLEVAIYQAPLGLTTPSQVGVATIATSLVESDHRNCIAYFDDLPIIPNRDFYLVFRQAGNGGDDSNDYDLKGLLVDSANIDALADGNQRFVYGTGDNPATYTSSSTFLPYVYPIFGNPLTDLLNSSTASYFDVTLPPFNAKGDGSNDDSQEIQQAIDAAEAAGPGSTVYIPRTNSVYLVEGLDVGGSGVRITGDGTLKLKGNSSATAVLKVAGNYTEVSGIRIDGNKGGSPMGDGHAIHVTASYARVVNVTAFNTKAATTSATFKFEGAHNLAQQCWSEDAGGVAYLDGGDYNQYQDCSAKNWGHAGFQRTSSAGKNRLDIDGGYLEPGDASKTKNCILFDGTTGSTAMVVIRNTVVDWQDDFEQSGSPSIAKFARVDWLILDNCLFKHKQELVDVEIGANVKRAHLDHTFLSRQMKLVSLDTEAVILLDDVQIGSDALWNGGVQPANAVLGIGGGQFIARSSQFIGYTAAALEVVLNLQSSTSFKHFEASDCLFYAYNTGVTTYEVATSGSGAVNVSRKILWLNNRSLNGGGSASQYSILNDDQKILFTTRDWSKRVMQAAGTPVGSTVTWQDGDFIMRDTPTSGGTIGWVKTSAGWKTFGTIES